MMVHAQETIPQQSQQESLLPSQDTTASSGDNVGSIFYGQPGKAALYSLVVPGGGQIYNKRYWKAPLVWALEGYAGYHLFNSIKRSKRATSCWLSSLGEANGLTADCGEVFEPSMLPGPGGYQTTAFQNQSFQVRQSARSQKDLAWILMSAAHLLNVIEAFVDRHLINFDVSEDLSFHNQPLEGIVQDNIYESVTLVRVTIPLGR